MLQCYNNDWKCVDNTDMTKQKLSKKKEISGTRFPYLGISCPKYIISHLLININATVVDTSY